MPVPCLFHTYASGFAKPDVPSTAPPAVPDDNKSRPAWQQRVITERDELLRRCIALRRFMYDQVEQFQALPQPDRDLLKLQYTYMGDYLNVLNERIQRFTPPVGA